MSDLADEIEAGGGTNEAVALALGWCRVKAMDDPAVYWRAPREGDWEPAERRRPPAFLTDLNALAAECERRGWWWEKQDDDLLVHTSRESFFGKGGPTAKEAARALCAALVRAVESEAADAE